MPRFVSANQAENWGKNSSRESGGLWSRLERAFTHTSRQISMAARQPHSSTQRSEEPRQHHSDDVSGSFAPRRNRARGNTQRQIEQLVSLGNWWSLLQNAATLDQPALDRAETNFNEQGGRTAAAAQHQIRLAAIEATETGSDPATAI